MLEKQMADMHLTRRACGGRLSASEGVSNINVMLPQSCSLANLLRNFYLKYFAHVLCTRIKRAHSLN
jgi:hypothetical protein